MSTTCRFKHIIVINFCQCFSQTDNKLKYIIYESYILIIINSILHKYQICGTCSDNIYLGNIFWTCYQRVRPYIYGELFYFINEKSWFKFNWMWQNICQSIYKKAACDYIYKKINDIYPAWDSKEYSQYVCGPCSRDYSSLVNTYFRQFAFLYELLGSGLGLVSCSGRYRQS